MMENTKRQSVFSRNYLLLPKVYNNPSKDTTFNFELYNKKTDGIIFILTILIIPFISMIIFRFVGGVGASGTGVSIFNVVSGSKQEKHLINYNGSIMFFSFLFGAIYFLVKDARLFVKSGAITIYLYFLLPSIFGFIPTLFVLKASDEVKSIVSMWTQIASEIAIVVFALWKTYSLKNRIAVTFKENWKNLLLVAIIGLVLIFVITTLLYNFIVQNTVLDQESENQKQLVKYLDNKFFVVTLFVFTILVAPFCEELIARNSFYTGVGSRIWGWILSALFFGMLHCSSSCDIQNIVPYFLAGLILSSIFNFTDGNMTYSWFAHAFTNSLAFGLLLIQHK